MIRCVCTFPSACFALKLTMCKKKRDFSAKGRVLAQLTSFLLKNAFKRREMLLLALVCLICIIQCVCTCPSASIALKPIMCKTRVFSSKGRVLAHLKSFLLKNAFKRREMLLLALVCLFLHNSMRLHVSQCFHCVKTDNV